MGRAEERRKARELTKKAAVYNLTTSQIATIKAKAVEEATGAAFKLMIGIPILVFDDHFKEFIRVEVDGKSRVERFADCITEFYKLFEKGLYDLEDVEKVLKDEYGIEIQDI